MSADDVIIINIITVVFCPLPFPATHHTPLPLTGFRGSLIKLPFLYARGPFSSDSSLSPQGDLSASKGSRLQQKFLDFEKGCSWSENEWLMLPPDLRQFAPRVRI